MFSLSQNEYLFISQYSSNGAHKCVQENLFSYVVHQMEEYK